MFTDNIGNVYVKVVIDNVDVTDDVGNVYLKANADDVDDTDDIGNVYIKVDADDVLYDLYVYTYILTRKCGIEYTSLDFSS